MYFVGLKLGISKSRLSDLKGVDLYVLKVTLLVFDSLMSENVMFILVLLKVSPLITTIIHK